jgi:hypothetical protein
VTRKVGMASMLYGRLDSVPRVVTPHVALRQSIRWVAHA